eukprot:PhM_4_TR3014/c1_g3_i2/m.89426
MSSQQLKPVVGRQRSSTTIRRAAPAAAAAAAPATTSAAALAARRLSTARTSSTKSISAATSPTKQQPRGSLTATTSTIKQKSEATAQRLQPCDHDDFNDVVAAHTEYTGKTPKQIFDELIERDQQLEQAAALGQELVARIKTLHDTIEGLERDVDTQREENTQLHEQYALETRRLEQENQTLRHYELAFTELTGKVDTLTRALNETQRRNDQIDETWATQTTTLRYETFDKITELKEHYLRVIPPVHEPLHACWRRWLSWAHARRSDATKLQAALQQQHDEYTRVADLLADNHHVQVQLAYVAATEVRMQVEYDALRLDAHREICELRTLLSELRGIHSKESDARRILVVKLEADIRDKSGKLDAVQRELAEQLEKGARHGREAVALAVRLKESEQMLQAEHTSRANESEEHRLRFDALQHQLAEVRAAGERSRCLLQHELGDALREVGLSRSRLSMERVFHDEVRCRSFIELDAVNAVKSVHIAWLRWREHALDVACERSARSATLLQAQVSSLTSDLNCSREEVEGLVAECRALASRLHCEEGRAVDLETSLEVAASRLKRAEASLAELKSGASCVDAALHTEVVALRGQVRELKTDYSAALRRLTEEHVEALASGCRQVREDASAAHELLSLQLESSRQSESAARESSEAAAVKLNVLRCDLVATQQRCAFLEGQLDDLHEANARMKEEIIRQQPTVEQRLAPEQLEAARVRLERLEKHNDELRRQQHELQLQYSELVAAYDSERNNQRTSINNLNGDLENSFSPARLNQRSTPSVVVDVEAQCQRALRTAVEALRRVELMNDDTYSPSTRVVAASRLLCEQTIQEVELAVSRISKQQQPQQSHSPPALDSRDGVYLSYSQSPATTTRSSTVMMMAVDRSAAATLGEARGVSSPSPSPPSAAAATATRWVNM